MPRLIHRQAQQRLNRAEGTRRLKEKELRRSRVLAGIALTAMLVVAGCGGGGGEDGGGDAGGSAEDNALTIWTTEDVADRVASQQKIMEAWAQKSGAPSSWLQLRRTS